MKKNLGILLILPLLTFCAHHSSERLVNNLDLLKTTKTQKTINLSLLFEDHCFTFLDLDSIDEEMLRDSSVKRDYKYIKSIKKFTKGHCEFFKTGCHGYFADDHVFLVAKQNSTNGITPVIIHDSGDFNYYHSEMFTLDKDFNKMDSLTVSLFGSGVESDEPSIHYKTKVYSKFKNNKITTTEIEYWHYSDNDSTVTIDSTIVYREITKDGKLKVLKKVKAI